MMELPPVLASREATLAMWRAVLSAAYAKQVRKGHNISKMAARLDVPCEIVERWLLVPKDMTIDELSDVCFSMDCEPTIKLHDGFASISVTPWPDEYAARVRGDQP